MPEEKQRRFELNCIDEEGELDRIYIEITTEEHRDWNSKNTVKQRKRKMETEFIQLSLDAPVLDSEVDSMHDTVASSFNLEALASDHVLIDELYKALQAWKPWAPEFLKIYLDGKGRSCTSILCKKYGLKERAVRYRKEQFKMFVKKFLK